MIRILDTISDLRIVKRRLRRASDCARNNQETYD
jgi:hypothetical protein